MAKRQLRIKVSAMKVWMGKLLNTKVSVVLKNKSVLFVKLIKFEEDYIEAQDAILRKHKIQVSDIQEIILEQHA